MKLKAVFFDMGGTIDTHSYDRTAAVRATEKTRLVADLPIEHRIINAELDGRFPQHGPNPLEPQNLRQVREEVLKEHADLGVCFDADGDRSATAPRVN